MSQIVELRSPRIKALNVKAISGLLKRLFFLLFVFLAAEETSCNKVCPLVFGNVAGAPINTEMGRAAISPCLGLSVRCQLILASEL